jgi:hypothetical protein
LVVVSVISYLETRRDCQGDASTALYANCQAFPKEVTRKLDGKYSTLLKRLALTRTSRSGRTRQPKRIDNEHGAMFHLAMLAYLQLQYEHGSPQRPYSQETRVNFSVKLQRIGEVPLGRNVDIVLQKGSAGEDNLIWVETKSLVGTSLKASPWTVKKGRTSAHRQFALDCMGRDGSQKEPKTSTFYWWLQDFRAKNGAQSGPSSAQVRKYSKKLHKMPKGILRTSFGGSALATTICRNVEVKRFDVLKRFIAGGISAVIFDGLQPSVVAELITP